MNGSKQGNSNESCRLANANAIRETKKHINADYNAFCNPAASGGQTEEHIHLSRGADRVRQNKAFCNPGHDSQIGIG